MKCPKCGANLLDGAQLCFRCGAMISGQQTQSQPTQRSTTRTSQPIVPQKAAKSASLKVWKLVSGIISIVLSMLVIFQSCAAGVANTLLDNGEVGGSAGVIVAFMLLSGGIVSIAVRNMINKGGNITIIVLYGIAALVGYMLAGSYSDLYVWSTWCLVCMIFGIVALVKSNGSAPSPTAPKTQKAVVKESAPTGAFRWWQIPIALGIFVLGFGIGFASNNNVPVADKKEPDKKQSSPSSASSASSESQVESKTEEPSSATSPALSDSGALGDYQVSILGARSGTDYEGNPVIIVEYDFTNNSDKNVSYMLAITDKAFQNGVQMESPIMLSDDSNYTPGDKMKDIQPGGSIKVEQAYILQDGSDVTVEVTESFSFSDTKLTKTFGQS